MRNYQAELVLLSMIYLAILPILDGSALSQVLLGSPLILMSFHLFTKNLTLLTFLFSVPLSPIFPVPFTKWMRAALQRAHKEAT